MATSGAARERDTVRLWRAWRTVHEMLQDRGYQLEQSEVEISLDDFKTAKGNNSPYADRKSMNFSAGPSADMITKYTHLDPAIQERNVTSKNIWTLGTIYVSFESDPNSDKKNTVNTTTLKAFFTLMESHKFSSGILISSAPPTPQAKNLMMAAADQGLRIECFTESELLVNITRHELVPKHILLSQEEKKQLLERYRVKETQLPRIQMADPVARYLGLRRNDVVKIIRKSETAGRYASYRWCLG